MVRHDENPLRVLVVAGKAVRRADLAEMAVKAIHARATTSPRVSLEEIRQLDPDLVLIDIDSTEAASATLRAVDGLAMSVIALTENPDRRWITDAIGAGIAAILSREVMIDELRLAFLAAESGMVLLHPAIAQVRVATASTDRRKRKVDETTEALTPREHEVLRLVAEGLGNREIARRLAISGHTVKFHVSSVLGKLGAGSRTEAVSQGIRNGLIPV